MDRNIYEQFLEGRNSQKYIVSVESSYENNYVYLVINDPEKGKFIEKHKFKPFLWMKKFDYHLLYRGNRNEIARKIEEYGIEIKELTTTDLNGNTFGRLEEGYRYIVHTDQSYSRLLQFFKYGGLDPYKRRDLFLMLSATEQYLIQTGKRLFKGMEDYNEVHRLVFDIETTGLEPETSRIFEIGIRDNRGFEEVIKIEDESKELGGIKKFFDIIDELKPAIICGYNSENFDFNFIIKRTSILGDDITRISTTLKYDTELKRKESTLKMGAEMEYYEQTIMWGYNIMDTWHAVRRAAAINSNIKETNLKYITKFEKIAKPNRIYIPGGSISTLWNSKDEFILNESNGNYHEYKNEELDENEKIVTGEYLVTRYLLDDLWETEQIDYTYNQATFLLSKIVPSTLSRTSTMGTAALWKTLMLGWSYENDLGIPSYGTKRKFTGGLSRLLKVGYSKNIVKFDYGSLYPSIQLTHNVFPDIDVSGALKGFLKYIFDSRALYKKKMKDAKKKGDHAKSKMFDRKQLPLKILNNSNFGSVSAPEVYPWGDIDVGELITCTGRQYLRLMIKFFMSKGYVPIVGDSVMHDTPVYVKYDNDEIDVMAISDIFDENSGKIDDGSLRDYSDKPYKILTKNGWKKINYVYRHESDKNIHNIKTSDRYICVTSDHSLFQNGEQIKPIDLVRGDVIDIYELPKLKSNNNNEISLEKAWLLGFFVGDGSSVYSNRKVTRYFSKKLNKKVTYNTTRSEWTINNSNLENLEKLQNILLNEYKLSAPIKDYRKSSGVYKLKTHNTELAKWFSSNYYSKYREKKIPISILNASKEIQKSFLGGLFAADGWDNTLNNIISISQKSQVNMAGIYMLLKNIESRDFRIVTRKDKENIITFNFDEKVNIKIERSPQKPNEVWDNRIIKNKNKYVYDISTEDGTFIAGVGGIVAKNTDGFNFITPDNIKEHTYITKGSHKNYKKGEKFTGIEGDIAEFNETYMKGVMELNIDEFCDASINISRKNYANLIDGEIKMTGNTLKSNKMPVYIEEFLTEGIGFLLNGNGKEFLNLYYNYIDKIYNKEIPLIKIASKSKVKQTIENYIKRSKETNIKGNPLPKQAHMELLLRENKKPNLGDIVYYVNTGTKKSHGDVQIKKNKETGDINLVFNSVLLDKDEINSVSTDVNYNIVKYIDSFNKRISPLLVCFSSDIRDKIIIETPEERTYFTDKEMELISGIPLDESDQDDLEKDLMDMEELEREFWGRMEIDPNYMLTKKEMM